MTAPNNKDHQKIGEGRGPGMLGGEGRSEVGKQLVAEEDHTGQGQAAIEDQPRSQKDW